jgi:uncharacterized protein
MTRRSRVITFVLAAAVMLLAYDLLKGPVQRPIERVEVQEDASEPAEEESPLIAVVLDDFGYSLKNLAALKDMDAPLTLAVLPGLPYSARVSDLATTSGMEVILHLPMEPEGETAALEKDTVMTGMRFSQISDIIDRDLVSVPGASGVSNHMGSKATADRELMEEVLSLLDSRGLFFLDSVTTARSVAGEIAAEKDMPYIRRDIFIDNKLDSRYIESQMLKAFDLALEQGSAVVIGHDRPETVETLSHVIPGAKEKGIKFVVLSEMITAREERAGWRQRSGP